jgi:lipoprotein-releasing system ATP-binding protein
MILQASNIFKKYESVQVLKGIDLKVDAAEIIAITGSSGAGKSTLLHIIGTLDKADSGTIVINNKDISSFSEKQLASFRNQQMGFVFQFHHLLPEFTALENVMLPALIGKEKESVAKKNATALLELLGLKDRITHRPNQLSGGEAQRVAICRALINKPAIVLADEPSGNLDSENALALHQLFLQLRNELKQTFIIVTHHEQLAAMADRKLVMSDGKMLA